MWLPKVVYSNVLFVLHIRRLSCMNNLSIFWIKELFPPWQRSTLLEYLQVSSGYDPLVSRCLYSVCLCIIPLFTMWNCSILFVYWFAPSTRFSSLSFILNHWCNSLEYKPLFLKLVERYIIVLNRDQVILPVIGITLGQKVTFALSTALSVWKGSGQWESHPTFWPKVTPMTASITWPWFRQWYTLV